MLSIVLGTYSGESAKALALMDGDYGAQLQDGPQ